MEEQTLNKKIAEGPQSFVFNQNVSFVRKTILVCILAYSSFGILDYILYPEHIVSFLLIRMGVVIYLGLLYGISYTTYFYKMREFLLMSIYFYAGLGIVIMVNLIGGDNFYTNGLYLVFGIGFYFIRLKFHNSIIAFFLVLGPFVVLTLVSDSMTVKEVLVNSIFYMAFSVIGIFGGFFNDRYIKAQFQYEKRVVEEKRVLEEKINLQLVQTNIDLKKNENELKYMSYHDALTGMKNRRYYEDNLIKLDIDENYPLTIVMSDINGLKLINDAFGHFAGDALLISAANLISDSCRETDLVARIGGDEFIIAMPRTSGEEAEKIIDIINKEAKKITIESIELSISFGFKTKHEKSEDIQEIFRSAEDLMYRVKLIEIPSMRSGAIETILNTLYEKDKSSEIHSRVVSDISEKLAAAYGMGSQEVNEVKTAGLLHDIGKIIIPISIITKEGKLTSEEYDLIKGHPEIGFRILNSTHNMRNISNIVLSHHERWDGLGYPIGIKTDMIPIQSRIIAIADAFDAMTSVRTYREILTNEQALEEIMNNAGTQFDPKLAQLFADNFSSIIINK